MDALNILIVEDDEDTRANLRDILELDGHRVIDAGTMAQAKQIASQDDIALVILDRKLPDGTAELVLPELRRLLPHAEMIVVTGFANMDATISALRQGVSDYILKPINPDALLKSVNRIVERRQMKHALSSEQAFANQILETAEAVVLVLDLAGNIVRFNPYFTRITGWVLKDVVGTDWFEQCVPAADHEWLRDVFLQTSENLNTHGIVNAVRTRAGQTRQIRWSNATIRDASTQATAVLAVGVDMTDLQEAQENALRSQRLAAIGQTMAALAHESRNALQRIQAGVEVLGLEIEGNPDAEKELGTIQRAARDLNELLEEIRSYAAPIHLNAEDGNLVDAWRHAWNSLKTIRGDRNVQLTETINNADLHHRFDPLRMERVFRNLMENTLAACTDPVKIEISCVRSDETMIEIEFADNGPGLTIEQRKRLFEPFFTTMSTGTGLGMSIVQRIVLAHGGEIAIGQPGGDDANVGAMFVLRIPRSVRDTV